MVLIKTLFYTGVRVSKLVLLKLVNVDLERCQIRIEKGKGQKDRLVPFPSTFRELLGMHVQQMYSKEASHLFESVQKNARSLRDRCGDIKIDISAQMATFSFYLAQSSGD